MNSSSNTPPPEPPNSVEAAVLAHGRGFTPIPIYSRLKQPFGHNWQHMRWDSEETVRASFEQYASDGKDNIGLLLGEASGGLLDVDLDHPKAVRLKDNFLPKTGMRTGRQGRPSTHYWYLATSDMPTNTRQYKLPNGEVSVELRSNGGQTVIPPSVHESGERYLWEGQPWGNPARINGRVLSVQVACLGLGAVLLDAWPSQGSRHEAFLALGGGLLRYGDGVHPYWKRNLPTLIRAIATATRDEDGADARVSETMETTQRRLAREDGKAVGFPRLAEIIGSESAEMARRIARDIEHLCGFTEEEEMRRRNERASTPSTASSTPPVAVNIPPGSDDERLSSMLPPPDSERNPLDERVNSWASVDLDPYLAGDVKLPDPEILTRDDGTGVMYEGRVNSLFGKSESGKSWVAMHAAAQQMNLGQRVLYLDMEDDPTGVISRFQKQGVGIDDIRHRLRYVRPESPNADMQRNRFGGSARTDSGDEGRETFMALLNEYDPTLIVVDGMTALYGLHGLDTNDASGTDVVTTWLKKCCRNGRTTVLIIDHTGKGAGSSSPIGAHHKIAMVQGTALRVDVIDRPVEGILGHLQLVIFKDRIGQVRKNAGTAKALAGDGETLAADVWIDSRDEKRVVISLSEPDPKVTTMSEEVSEAIHEVAGSSGLREKMLRLFEGDMDASLTTADVMHGIDIEDNEVNRRKVREAWKALRGQGLVERLGTGPRNTSYRLTGGGAATLDRAVRALTPVSGDPS